MERKSKSRRLRALFCTNLMIMFLVGFFTNSMSIQVSAYTPRTSAPAKDNQYYYSSLNPFYPRLGLPNCTCYAYGRAYEILGYDPNLPTGNAGNWYPNDKKHEKDSTPKLGAIACWKGTTSEYPFGHVAVVEAINGSKVSLSESNYGGSLFKYRENVNPNTVFSSIGYVFQGYIYIDVPETNYSPGSITGTYYMKNKSTGTYLYMNGSDANKTDIALSAKKETAAFQMIFTKANTSDEQRGCFIRPAASSARVINPYADTPVNGTDINLFDKSADGTQQWILESVSGGYVIRNYCNNALVLTASGSTVTLATYNKAATQIWTLEDATKAPATLSSIAINADSVGTIYENDSQMDTSGLTLTATYSDKTKKTISSGYSLTRPSLTAAGTKTLTVTYEGKTATLDITVQDLFKGNGTASEPYLISTDEDLKNLANMVNNTSANPCYGTAHYKQTADIDLSLYDWTPIGTFYASANDDTTTSRAVFNGTYNGNFHKITGLHVNYKRMYTGLFGRTNANAVIENLSVTGSVISTGSACIGGIVGEAGYGSTIRNCDFSGSVTGTNLVGAIAGKLHAGGTISNCYANADVKATNGHAGGIAGNITVGNKTNSVDGLVENSYFAGTAAGTANGGICGSVSIQTVNESTLTFKNCYYLNSAANGAVNGTAQSGCMGLISSQLRTIAPDLGSPFADNPYSTLNGGYPVFEWQLAIAGDVNTDGTVSVPDVVALQKHLLTTASLNAEQLRNADMYDDDVVDGFDLAFLKRVLLSE